MRFDSAAKALCFPVSTGSHSVAQASFELAEILVLQPLSAGITRHESPLKTPMRSFMFQMWAQVKVQKQVLLGQDRSNYEIVWRLPEGKEV